jgi:GrpB-like predicted nucleotidyltransferase (UPF0157 family)/chloramphenicol 3-O-phosphotransferase
MIVIINGPLGGGKTEVSWKLLRMFGRAVMLDGDYIGAVQPFDIYDEERVAYLYRTLHHLIAFHVANGCRDFVVNYVFETPESLAQLRHLLSDLDDVIYVFRLTCADDEMERRLRARGNQELGWEMKRFRELTAIMEAGADRGDLGYEIDTVGLTPEGVARAIWLDIHEAVEVVPYDPAWPAAYRVEEARLRTALGDRILAIHHIGSTAVPGLDAKPIIDILVTVRRLEEAVACIAPLRKLGYAFVDYPQNRDRRFFRKGKPRSHHLHIVEQDSPDLADKLAFRDALRADPDLRQAYADLKAQLATRYQDDRATYSERKTAFVRTALRS